MRNRWQLRVARRYRGTKRRALGFEPPLGLREEATSPLFYSVIIQTDTQLGYKVPVCSAGVRGFAVFFILLDFFSYYKAKKTGTWRAKGSGQIGVLPVRVYISFIHLDAFRCPADLAAWVIMGDGRCLESKA